jgi:uncharacterized protein with PIN domain
MRAVLQGMASKGGSMIHLASVILICSYCNAEIERVTEREAREALLHHQQYVQCIKNY